MNTVTTINLAGAAFQVEDPGYDALKRYLDGAKAALEGNPDRDEIVADMERAIADKCRARLSAHKTVVSADDAAKIVAEMGPVNASDADGAGSADGAGAGGAGAPGSVPKPKRLYRVIEGEWLGGVANGFAAYLDVDVTLIRVLIIVLTMLTGGGFCLAYFIAWMIIPPAETAQQRAQAYGAPFNAQEIVDRVKAEYARFEARMPQWKSELEKAHDAHKQWKRERKQTRQQQRAQRRAWERGYAQQWRHQPSAVGELLWLIFVVFLFWLAYQRVPIAHEFMDAVWNFITATINTITAAAVNR